MRIVADAGHAVVKGVVVAGIPAGVSTVVYAAVVVETAAGVAASKEVRRKDARKAPQPAGPFISCMEEGGGFVAAAPVMELREVFRRFWPYARPYRRWLPLILFFAVLGSAVPILRPEGWRLWPGPPSPVYSVVPSHVSIAHRRQWRSWPTRDPRCLSEVLLLVLSTCPFLSCFFRT